MSRKWIVALVALAALVVPALGVGAVWLIAGADGRADISSVFQPHSVQSMESETVYGEGGDVAKAYPLDEAGPKTIPNDWAGILACGGGVSVNGAELFPGGEGYGHIVIKEAGERMTVDNYPVGHVVFVHVYGEPLNAAAQGAALSMVDPDGNGCGNAPCNEAYLSRATSDGYAYVSTYTADDVPAE